MKVLVIIMVLFALAPQVTYADKLTIGVSKQGDKSIEKPKAGVSMDKVRQRYGQPERVVNAVGEPPITRWYYPEFTVYFEFDKVVHAVRKLRD